MARTSDELATRNGLTALRSAKSGIERCLKDVENTRMGLVAGYQGSDGYAYADLLMDWEEYAVRIGKSLDEMIDSLETTSTHVRQNQETALEDIKAAKSKGNSTYQTLLGH